MTDKRTQQHSDQGNMEKDPGDWVTGDEPMTGAQRSYLKTLSEEARVPFEDGLTKAQASKRIEELQARTGRGENNEAAPESGEQRLETPLESLGRAVSETVLGSAASGLPGGVAPDGSNNRSPG